MALSFDEFCGRLEHLRLDRSGGLVKPYKPLLLTAVVVLIHKGKQRDRNVLLDGGLRSGFQQLLEALFPRWPNQAKPEYPFRHLENDGVWHLVPIEGASEALRAARDARAEAWDVLKHVRCAQLDEGVFERLATSFEARFKVLRILSRRYFPTETSGKLWDYLSDELPPGPVALVADGAQLTERALEEHLELHWDETPFAAAGVELARREVHGWPGRQVFTPVNAIDLLGFEPAKRRWWVFELKRGRSADAVVGQVSRYLGWISEERRGHRETAVGAVVVKTADPKLRYAVRAHERLSLWEFDDGFKVTQVC
ncbi:MAG TPA: hypothetical protein VFE30_05315 [Anaeromyxobacteraceae bacterium]|jgi:hypothetical protein|nr:hypothetical protein [Anaeromyxobacteraceae bacterium]